MHRRHKCAYTLSFKLMTRALGNAIKPQKPPINIFCSSFSVIAFPQAQLFPSFLFNDRNYTRPDCWPGQNKATAKCNNTLSNSYQNQT